MIGPGNRSASPSKPRRGLLTAIWIAMAIALLGAALLPLAAPADAPLPQAEAEVAEYEGEEEGEEWELEEEEEEGEEEEFGARASTPLPPACLLRTADPTVVAQLGHESLRLTLRYTARVPTKVTVDYWLKGGKGSLQLGSSTRRFDEQGVLRMSRHLDEHEIAKMQAARVFVIDLDVPAAPSYCQQYLTMHLSAKSLHRSRATWSERPGPPA